MIQTAHISDLSDVLHFTHPSCGGGEREAMNATGVYDLLAAYVEGRAEGHGGYGPETLGYAISEIMGEDEVEAVPEEVWEALDAIRVDADAVGYASGDLPPWVDGRTAGTVWLGSKAFPWNSDDGLDVSREAILAMLRESLGES